MGGSAGIVFVVCGLSDNLVRTHVEPIARSRTVRSVVVLRNIPGPELPNTSYVCPPGVICRSAVTALIWKLVATIVLAMLKRPQLIHGLLLMPHGIIAMMAGTVTHTRFGVTLVAGSVEFFALMGSPLGVDVGAALPRAGRLLLRACRKASLIGVMSSKTARFLVDHGVDPCRVALLPNPVDLVRFRPSQSLRIYDVISVSRLTPVKRVETVVRVTAALRPHFPCLKVAVVGDGPCLSTLRALAGDLGVADCISFLGYRSDIPDLLNASRVFMMTSEREGGPMALAEAMACGLPCVASKCGMVADLCTNGVDSIVVVDHRDVDGFASGVAALLRDHDLRKRMSSAARRKAETLSMERAVAAWESAIGRVDGSESLYEG